MQQATNYISSIWLILYLLHSSNIFNASALIGDKILS